MIRLYDQGFWGSVSDHFFIAVLPVALLLGLVGGVGWLGWYLFF